MQDKELPQVAEQSYPFDQRAYISSPNGEYGYFEDIYYSRPQMQKRIRVFMKNLLSGEILQIIDVGHTPRIKWLKNSTLLINRYSEEKKQNEIVIYRPKEDIFIDIIDASLYAINKNDSLVLFALNELSRTRRILNLETGELCLYRQGDYDKLFFNSEISYPQEADIQGLEYEHQLVFEDSIIDVPYVFQRDGQLFIPVRPLMERIQIQAARTYDSKYQQTYKLSYKQDIILDKSNMIIVDGRLFTTQQALAAIGVPEFDVRSLLE